MQCVGRLLSVGTRARELFVAKNRREERNNMTGLIWPISIYRDGPAPPTRTQQGPLQPSTWRLQRALLRSRWWRGPVTVYGNWPDQPSHIVPFFTSVLSNEQLTRARAHAKKPSNALHVLFVGRLTKSKNVDVLLEAMAGMKANVTCTIVGEGSERTALATYARQLGLNGEIRFVGGASFEQVLDWYERSDVLVLA